MAEDETKSEDDAGVMLLDQIIDAYALPATAQAATMRAIEEVASACLAAKVVFRLPISGKLDQIQFTVDGGLCGTLTPTFDGHIVGVFPQREIYRQVPDLLREKWPRITADVPLADAVELCQKVREWRKRDKSPADRVLAAFKYLLEAPLSGAMQLQTVLSELCERTSGDAFTVIITGVPRDFLLQADATKFHMRPLKPRESVPGVDLMIPYGE